MKGRIQRDTHVSILLPRIGMIKVGEKSEKGYPRSVDYFIPSGKYAALFTKEYGDKPQTIQIVFPSDDPELVCNEQYEYRDDNGKRIAYGDGINFMVWKGKCYEPMSKEQYPNLMIDIAKKYPNRAVKSGGDGWSVTLTITFIIPKIGGIAGVWQFISKGSASTIPNIRNTFDAMIEELGRAKGILCDLNVQYAKSQKPGDTSRYPVVTLVPNESAENIKTVRESIKAIGQ